MPPIKTQNLTIATLFAGCGGKTIGAIAATGGTPIWAIEYEAEIAQLYARNVCDRIICKIILDVDPRNLRKPDKLLVSPPCPSFSACKIGREETSNDRSLAQKICEFIKVLNPKYIFIENVRGYQNSNSYQQLIAQLGHQNYYWDAQVVNSADYGVPQTRERLIVRASKEQLPPLIQTHAKEPTITIWGERRAWIGWYEALKDIIETLPECKLANWQKTRMLDREVPPLALIERSGARQQMQIRGATTPSFTIRAMSGNIRPSINQANILISGQDGLPRIDTDPSFTITSEKYINRILLAGGGQATPRSGGDPAITILANSSKGRILDDAKCYQVSVAALARLQSFPDWYQWSDKKSVNIRAIGNAVPPLLAEAIVRSMIS
ncbi:MAG: DNA cytosine methyltransferase [Hydrococcus sp. CSU_1_8]|nr:DNA cytosine methyltransferase [Hydrococcus sp. CSU_1_8]